MFLVAFEFWVNKCVSKTTIAYGRDFNKDDLWDLAIYEIPAGGYPHIKEAIKKTKKEGYFTKSGGRKLGISHLSMMQWALEVLDKELGALMN